MPVTFFYGFRGILSALLGILLGFLSGWSGRGGEEGGGGGFLWNSWGILPWLRHSWRCYGFYGILGGPAILGEFSGDSRIFTTLVGIHKWFRKQINLCKEKSAMKSIWLDFSLSSFPLLLIFQVGNAPIDTGELQLINRFLEWSCESLIDLRNKRGKAEKQDDNYRSIFQ